MSVRSKAYAEGLEAALCRLQDYWHDRSPQFWNAYHAIATARDIARCGACDASGVLHDQLDEKDRPTVCTHLHIERWADFNPPPMQVEAA